MWFWFVVVYGRKLFVMGIYFFDYVEWKVVLFVWVLDCFCEGLFENYWSFCRERCFGECYDGVYYFWVEWLWDFGGGVKG